MPNTRSAQKQLVKSMTRRQRNRSRKSTMRTWVRRTVSAVEAKDLEKAEQSLSQAFKLIDKNAKWNLVHANNAARRKAKLARMVHELRQAASQS